MESSDEEDMLTFDTEIISSDQLPAASDPELEEEEEGDVIQTGKMHTDHVLHVNL